MNLSVLGLGNIGLPRAKRLCATGHSIGAWNIHPGNADGLTKLGATVH